MKQQDIAIIILVIGIAAGVSFFASNALFASGKKKEQEIVKIDKITAEFTPVSSKYFNPQAVNPTRMIKIGESSNQNPFNGSQ